MTDTPSKKNQKPSSKNEVFSITATNNPEIITPDEQPTPTENSAKDGKDNKPDDSFEDDFEHSTKPKKRTGRKVFFLILVAALGAFGFFWYQGILSIHPLKENAQNLWYTITGTKTQDQAVSEYTAEDEAAPSLETEDSEVFDFSEENIQTPSQILIDVPESSFDSQDTVPSENEDFSEGALENAYEEHPAWPSETLNETSANSSNQTTHPDLRLIYLLSSELSFAQKAFEYRNLPDISKHMRALQSILDGHPKGFASLRARLDADFDWLRQMRSVRTQTAQAIGALRMLSQNQSLRTQNEHAPNINKSMNHEEDNPLTETSIDSKPSSWRNFFSPQYFWRLFVQIEVPTPAKDALPSDALDQNIFLTKLDALESDARRGACTKALETSSLIQFEGFSQDLLSEAHKTQTNLNRLLLRCEVLWAHTPQSPKELDHLMYQLPEL